VTVEGVTINELCKDNKIKEIDILKLDVEGAEMDILKNSGALLKNIKKIVVEYHTPKLKKEIKNFLRKNNFILLAEEKEKQGIGGCGDLYFLRGDQRN